MTDQGRNNSLTHYHHQLVLFKLTMNWIASIDSVNEWPTQKQLVFESFRRGDNDFIIVVLVNTMDIVLEVAKYSSRARSSRGSILPPLEQYPIHKLHWTEANWAFFTNNAISFLQLAVFWATHKWKNLIANKQIPQQNYSVAKALGQ